MAKILLGEEIFLANKFELATSSKANKFELATSSKTSFSPSAHKMPEEVNSKEVSSTSW